MIVLSDYTNKQKRFYKLSAEIRISDEQDIKTLSQDFDVLKGTQPNGLLYLPRSTLIVGDGIYNDSFHPDNELMKSFTTMERQPMNINHSEDILDETGFWKDAQYNDKKLSAVPVINLNTANAKKALGYIQNRMYAGKPAEVSVGFWATVTREQFEYGGKKLDMDVTREIEFDHAALVSRGACSPTDGAGIGLSAGFKVEKEEINKFLKKEEGEMTKKDKEESEPITNQEDNEEPEVTEEETEEEDDEEEDVEEIEDNKNVETEELKKQLNIMKKEIEELKKQKAVRKTKTRDGLEGKELHKEINKTGMELMRSIGRGNMMNLRWQGKYNEDGL